jgi:hypothetical protein
MNQRNILFYHEYSELRCRKAHAVMLKTARKRVRDDLSACFLVRKERNRTWRHGGISVTTAWNSSTGRISEKDRSQSSLEDLMERGNESNQKILTRRKVDKGANNIV